MIHKGPIPEGLGVLHKCDNPPCPNPDHLFLGSTDDNMKDAAKKGRMPRGLSHHKGRLTVDQVLEIRRLLADKQLSQTTIGRRFQVSRSTILSIRRKNNYGYVEG
jgi:response regulator of citrate/malate metabolism